MADRDLFDLEMSPGLEPPSGIGDRILVGIAALALVGGLFIAVVNALPDDEEAARASAAPSESPSASPPLVPTPQPPRVATVQPGEIEVPAPDSPSTFYGWIRTAVDIVIRVSPEPDATQIGVLEAGMLAFADQQGEPSDEPGWLSLQDRPGWIATVADGEQLVHRYEYPRYRGSGSIDTISAGPQGFVAMIRPPSGPDVYPRPAPATSVNGAQWRSAGPSGFESWDSGSVAWGPAGWLAITYVYGPDWNLGDIWIWRSADGLDWARLGKLAGLSGEYPNSLVASDRGYLLATSSQSGSSSGALWSSADGQTWIESKDRSITMSFFGDRRIQGLAGGFYLWDPSQDARPDAFAAFSVDGQRWTRVGNGPTGANLQLAAYGDRILAIDADRQTMAARVWTGTVVRGQMLWIRQPESQAAFAGGAVTRLVSDGTQAYAFGWDRSTDAPLVWIGDGKRWTRSRLPASFQGIPNDAAAGPTGVVVVGHRPTLRGDNPILWHLTPTGRWLPEDDPIVPPVPDPSTDDCAPLPTDFAAFTVLDAAAAVVCHGDAPTTLRAWSVRCDGCGGGYWSNAEPAWLLNPEENQLGLSPTDWTDGGWQSVVLSPALTMEDSWADTWLEVTGHFDDPVSVTCHVEPRSEDLIYFPGQQSVIDQCRQTFVVTEVKVVSGP
jgi:hypothetical protein